MNKNFLNCITFHLPGIKWVELTIWKLTNMEFKSGFSPKQLECDNVVDQVSTEQSALNLTTKLQLLYSFPFSRVRSKCSSDDLSFIAEQQTDYVVRFICQEKICWWCRVQIQCFSEPKINRKRPIVKLFSLLDVNKTCIQTLTLKLDGTWLPWCTWDRFQQ